jgi:hypothetical protein
MIVIGSFRQYSLAVNGTLTVASESEGGFVVNQRDNLTKQIRLVSASYTGATQDAYVKFYRNQGKLLVTKKMEWDAINEYWYYNLRADETALYGTIGVSFELTETGSIDVILSSTMLTFEINKSGVVVVDDGVSSYSGIDTETADISIDNNNNTIKVDVLNSPKLGGVSASSYALKSESLSLTTLNEQTVLSNVTFEGDIDAPNMVKQLSSGATEKPTLTDLGTGSVTVNACCVNLYNNDDFNGLIKNYDIAPITVELNDGATNYIVADYNGGNPILRKTIDRSEINQSNIVPIFTIVRTGLILHTLDWDEMGKGAIEKNIEKAVAVRRFERESGLALATYGTRNVSLSSGAVWYGLTRVALDQILSATDNIYLYYHTAGVWTLAQETQFRNTQYDNGTDLVELTANRYAVIWFWRGVENQKHLYAVLGGGDYTINQATASDVPNPPSTVSSHAILVGRIIVQKGSNTPESVESAFDITMNLSGASVHNDLTGRDAENSHPASSINYSNTTSGLTATNSQVAIDEIVGLIGDIGEALDIINGEVV